MYFDTLADKIRDQRPNEINSPPITELVVVTLVMARLVQHVALKV